MVLARLMCWTTIVTELGVVPAIFIPRLQYWAVCANILFQSGLVAVYRDHVHAVLL